MPRKKPEGSPLHGGRQKAKAKRPAKTAQKAADGRKAKPIPDIAAEVKAASESPRPVGRPSDYRPEYAEQARKLSDIGWTDIEMADFFGICEKTFYNWQHAHPAFLQAIKLGKDAPDDRMERSLYHRGKGYEWTEEQAIKLREETWVAGEKQVSERVEIVKIRRQVPPDTTAAIFWLKNRRGWKDKSEVDHGVTDTLAALLQQLDGKTPRIPNHAAP